MKHAFDVFVSTPGVLFAFVALIPMVISMFPITMMKDKRWRRIFSVVFFLSMIAASIGAYHGTRDMGARYKAQDQLLQENPRIMQLAENVANNMWKDSVAEAGSAEVREPWLILRVDGSNASDFKLADVMYSDPVTWLTQETLDKVQTICLWCTHPWETAQYVSTSYAGGATITCSSQKAYCWIYSIIDGSASLQETYTLYSQALTKKVSGEVHNTVRPSQVRKSVLDRIAPLEK